MDIYLARYGTKKHYAFSVTVGTGNTQLHNTGSSIVHYRLVNVQAADILLEWYTSIYTSRYTLVYILVDI